MKPAASARSALVLDAAMLSLMAILLFLMLYNSFGWRMELDAPLFNYVSWMMDRHGAFPYRDIFETSMPGTFAFYYAAALIFGYEGLGFRILDVSVLAVLLILTYCLMRRFGRLPALWTAIVFGIFYFSMGTEASLQRDYIGTIPIAVAFLVLPARKGERVALARFAQVGFLFGISSMIKPHLAMGLPVFFWALLALHKDGESGRFALILRCLAVTGFAFVIPIVIALFWLFEHSALHDFLDIVWNYLPLHNRINGYHQTLVGFARLKYLVVRTLWAGGYLPLLFAAFLAYRQAGKRMQDEALRVSLNVLLASVLVYAFYPTIAGKFWGYHYMPLAYFSIALSSLLLYKGSASGLSLFGQFRLYAIPVAAVILVITLRHSLPRATDLIAQGLQASPRSYASHNDRVDEMAGWLKARLQPGDTVQPLDWTGGSIHAMLLARARLATRFMYDYHFYHDVSSSYTRALRKDFIRQLAVARPRFIIDVQEDKPWVSGFDSSHDFPELTQFLRNNYSVALRGHGYVIYEMNCRDASCGPAKI